MSRISNKIGFSVLFSCAFSWVVMAHEDSPLVSNTAPKECEFAHVSFKANFEGARLNACKKLEDGSYLLTTDAENRPINPSPWYAFSVSKKGTQKNKNVTTKQTINIIIAATKAKPRYLPKLQLPSGDWQLLNFSANKMGMKISLSLGDSPLKIAAQPIIDNSHYGAWSDEFANKGLFNKFDIGNSSQGRPIFALVNKKQTNHEWLVLIGRQHPPEVTGAIAMLSFAQSINTNTPKLKSFYDRFNVLIVPNLNPDGVANGNWRHNVKGADLNRDWGKFVQIETKVVNDYLESLLQVTDNQTPKLVFAVDFHSTQQDIFYTMPADYDMAAGDFSENWLKAVKANTLSSFVVRNRPGSSPGRGVFKQFIADTYRVPAITYEVGDNTPLSLIEHVANISADELIKLMLATPKEDFDYKMIQD